MMAAESMIELISKSTIKPFSETSSSLRLFKLSAVDQLMPNTYVPLSFLFCSRHDNNNNNGSVNLSTRSQTSLKLQDSLSRTLSYYYPFAGRLNKEDEQLIDCNDDGVLFLQVQINKSMSQCAEYPADSTQEDLLFPKGLPWEMSNEGYLAVFQLSHFECGGMAISACISHKLADASTAAYLINDWALMTRKSGSHVPSPQFIGNLIFKPPKPHLPSELEPFVNPRRNVVTRTYVFDAPRIAQLKSMADSSRVEKPTRVEVVLALLLQRMVMSVAKCRQQPFPPSSVLYQAMNLRPLLIPPTPENSTGNILSCFYISVSSENEMEFSEIVDKLRDAKIEKRDKEKAELEANDNFAIITPEKARHFVNPETDSAIDYYYCTSWCGFPLYQTDFGWGRPSKVRSGNYVTSNSILLLDAPSGDGIEAMIGVEEQAGFMLECDAELLKFAATPN